MEKKAPFFVQLCSSKSDVLSASPKAFTRTTHQLAVVREMGMKVKCQATSVPADDRVPDMGKRQLMNLLLLGTLSLPTAGMLVPYASFFVPPGLV